MIRKEPCLELLATDNLCGPGLLCYLVVEFSWLQQKDLVS